MGVRWHFHRERADVGSAPPSLSYGDDMGLSWLQVLPRWSRKTAVTNLRRNDGGQHPIGEENPSSELVRRQVLEPRTRCSGARPVGCVPWCCSAVVSGCLVTWILVYNGQVRSMLRRKLRRWWQVDHGSFSGRQADSPAQRWRACSEFLACFQGGACGAARRSAPMQP